MESAEKEKITVDNDGFVQIGPTVYGWVCPKCGRALSPTTSVCPCWALKDAPIKAVKTTTTTWPPNWPSMNGEAVVVPANDWKSYTTEVTAD